VYRVCDNEKTHPVPTTVHLQMLPSIVAYIRLESFWSIFEHVTSSVVEYEKLSTPSMQFHFP
jgi:hypothetical protein